MKFVKKPVEIEAMQYTDDTLHDVRAWMFKHASLPDVSYVASTNQYVLHIATGDGEVRAYPGDWIIMGVGGMFYTCKPDIFARSFDAADDAPLVGQFVLPYDDEPTIRDAK